MSRTVLVVDDHDTFRRLAGRLIEQAGFTLAGEATDAAGAVRLAEELSPDAVLLDVGLPDRSGLEIVGELGSADVVLVSSNEDWRELAEETSARTFVRKDELTADSLRAALG